MKHIFVRSLLVLLFALVLVGNLFADDDLPFDTYPQALGAYVGRISGIGIGYQKWNDTYGFQFAAGGMYHPLMEGGHDIFNYKRGSTAAVSPLLGRLLHLACRPSVRLRRTQPSGVQGSGIR